ncbi:MAG: hypothetical protein C0467_31505 [Planctomycetaceae bacterium]|nr:hypothetical protein [Planctomycetaceae bacterium]
MIDSNTTAGVSRAATAWHIAIVAVLDLAGHLRDVMREGDPETAAAAEKTTRDLIKVFQMSLQVSGKEP